MYVCVIYIYREHTDFSGITGIYIYIYCGIYSGKGCLYFPRINDVQERKKKNVVGWKMVIECIPTRSAFYSLQ